jgi:RNA polymerase sigma-70 factor, ECF subfamily
MVNAVRDFTNFRGSTVGEFETLLRKIMHHEIAKKTRHFMETQKRQVSREEPFIFFDEDDGEVADFVDASAPKPDAELLLEERASVVQFAVSLLEAPLREVIEWHFLEEISWEEIAERLGCTVEQAQSKGRIGLRKLRGVFEALDCKSN